MSLAKLSGPVAAMMLLSGTASASILLNGSFEDLNNNWTNTLANYMAVPGGNSSIADWSVSASGRGVVWGKNTTSDGYNASQGSYFVDLSGFGNEAGLSVLSQNIQNLVIGQTYAVGLDFLGQASSLWVGSNHVLNSGNYSQANSWSHLTGSFVATQTTELLQLKNDWPAASIVFVYNLTVAGPEATSSTVGNGVPEPGTWTLILPTLLAFGFTRRLRKNRLSAFPGEPSIRR